MADSVKSSRWVAISGWMTVLSTVSAVTWALWDHVHPKAAAPAPTAIYSPGQPSTSVHGNHNKITTNIASGNGNTVNGSGNVVNNTGIVTINSARTIPSSEKEAARQRLHDSGIEYSSDRFYSGLQNHESDVVGMFTESGMKLSPGDMGAFADGNFYDPEIANILSQVDQSSSCPADVYSGAFYMKLQAAPLAFVKKICSNDAARSRLREALRKAQENQKNARDLDRENDELAAHQLAVCEQAKLEIVGSRESRASIHEQCVYPPAKSLEAGWTDPIAQLEKALTILSN